MQFSEKLDYLFELTRAEGKELAAAMNITPPQISKMRRGVRGLPKNEDAARTLARFFAQRCSSDQQRDSLSKAIRVAQIRNVDKESELTDILLDWLSDDRDPDEYAAKRADDFLRQFGSLFESGGEIDPDGESGRVLESGQSSFFAYYGSEGKRLAVQTFLNYILQRKQACTINILTDESMAWMVDDPAYSKRIQKIMVRLTEQGCTFRRVAGPIMDMDQAFESLSRWLPLYLTGKATSYYYKRMRDNLNRMTLFVVPGVAVMFSFSVGVVPQQNGVTFFTVDGKTVDSMSAEFENYYALCEPIMNVHSEPRHTHACMLDYESCGGACIQRSNSLSFITLPWDIAMALRADGRLDEKNDFLTSFAQRYKKFKSNIERFPCVDIIRLAEPDEVMAGKTPIPAAMVLGGQMQYYSPQSYTQHLRSVLYLLEHRENYHVVLREPEDTDPTIIYVKEGHCAILARDAVPFSIFEVSERYLVAAFTEYLRRRIPESQSDLSGKRHAAAKLRALINELEQRMRQTEA